MLWSVAAYTRFIFRKKRAETQILILWHSFSLIHTLIAVTPRHAQVQPSDSFIISHCCYLSPSSAILFAQTAEAPGCGRWTQREVKKQVKKKKDSSSSGWLLRQQSLAESGCVWADVVQHNMKQHWKQRGRSVSPINTRQLDPLFFFEAKSKLITLCRWEVK